MTISTRGARAIDPASGLDRVGDLHIEAGKIVAIGTAPAGFGAQKILDDADLVAASRPVDLSVALRGPDYGHKGNVENEIRTAVTGSIINLCYPPYTRPVLDTPAVAELILDRACEAGNAKVYPIGALTRGFGGEQLSELVALHDTGYVAFTNGLHGFASNRTLRHALEYATTFDLTVIFTSRDTDLAEGSLAHESPTTGFLGLTGTSETARTVTLVRSLLLVEQSGVRARSSQLTSTRGTELVARAQARGLPVTYDAAPYRLVLTDEVPMDSSSLYHVQPSLRTRADREALREAVRSDVMQAIAGHHQPHEVGTKNTSLAATKPGISGAELLLLLAMILVQDGLLNLPTLLARLSHDPAQALRLFAGRPAVGQAADLMLSDPQGSTLAGESWYSKGQNSPFVGYCLLGRVRHTLADGHLVREG